MFRSLNVRLEGDEFLPASGPVVLAARHYHHLFDGATLVHALARQPHIFVALDWARSPWQRLVMETVCELADWPVALRGDNLDDASAYAKSEGRRYVRRSVTRGAELLRRGHVLAVFPEGYPTIDPAGSPKTNDAAVLPFRPGLLAVVARAQRQGAGSVPIVPAGLSYAARGPRYAVTLRLGAPLHLEDGAPRTSLLEALRARVAELSGLGTEPLAR